MTFERFIAKYINNQLYRFTKGDFELVYGLPVTEELIKEAVERWASEELRVKEQDEN